MINILDIRENKHSNGNTLTYTLTEYTGTAKPYGVKRPGQAERRYKTIKKAHAAFIK